MKIVTVVGARPQFVKAGPLSRELRRSHEEVLVHTGQHYDPELSDVFFAELGLPRPDYDLAIGSGPHGAQTGAMLAATERLLVTEEPDIVLVYGDTNSTIAAALAASKLGIPIAHVEAGLRSFNRAMPEEINRVVTDHLSTWLFAPSEAAAQQLGAEGITHGVHVVGDIMCDAIRLYGSCAGTGAGVAESLGLQPRGYHLCTVHRAENTDRRQPLERILAALERLDLPVVLPLHPRTRERLSSFDLRPERNVLVVGPVGYLEMLRLQSDAATVLTDSGGMQKEAYYLRVPCVTLREETEWTETVETGWNTIAGTDPQRILAAAGRAQDVRDLPHPDLYGTGDTAMRIVEALNHHQMGT